MSTLYHALGLPQGASHEQVKSAFRALARRFHPDVNAGNNAAEQRFKEVSQAYETLADPRARAAYDRSLVCRAAEVRRRRWNFAATAATTFALTTSTIGLALWWTQAIREPRPVQASVPDQAERAPIVGAQEAKPANGEAVASTADLATPTASPEGQGSSGWATYRSARFSFALRYPADMFAYDLRSSSENVRTFVSQSGAILHIFNADNVAETTLTRYRRSRMEARYAGAIFDKVPRRKFGFVLSGRQGGSGFYERVTFACDGRAIYGWQMIFPVSRRTLYDLVAHKVDSTYTQRIRPSAQCSESLSSAGGERRHHRELRHWKTARRCWLKHGYYWKCDYHHYRNYY
jgi:curved DNA-binding protein CbpA